MGKLFYYSDQIVGFEGNRRLDDLQSTVYAANDGDGLIVEDGKITMIGDIKQF